MRSIFISLWDSLTGLGEAILNVLLQKDHGYSASFGSEKEFISRSADGFSVTGIRQLTIEQSTTHLAVVSPSGGGKTTVNIIPTILRQTRSSLLINDNSIEIRTATANYLRSKGYRVRYLDFDVEHFTTQNAFYNPLARIKSKADIAKITSILVSTTEGKGGDKFWNIKAMETISLAIELVLRDSDPRTHHLASVHRTLQMMVTEEDRVSFQMVEHDDLFLKWQVLLSNSPNTKASIFSSAISALSFIDTNLNLALLTSKDTISFDEMRSIETALFISVPLAYSEIFEPLLNCFYSQFFGHILESPLPDEKRDLPILCLMDEFGSSMKVPNFPKYISNLRKFYVCMMMVLQSESQLKKYGDAGADEILSSCTKVYFTGLDKEADKISNLLGKYSYTDKKEHQKERHLMTPDEVRTMPSNRCVIIPIGGKKGIIGKLVPFYKQQLLIKRSEIELEDEEEVSAIYPTITYINFPEIPDDFKTNND
jgi:type IV secretion system protein VirD4